MHILVTGAGGFAGGNIANYLQSQGHVVTGVIHNTKAVGDFDVVKCDLSKPWIMGGNFDVIVHSAATLPYRKSDFKTYYQNNTVSMENLIEFALKHDVRRVINISTIGVYGEFRDSMVTEDTDKINLDPYGMTKYVAECLLYSESKIKSISLRLPGIIGAGCQGIWLSNIVSKFLNDELVEIYTPDFQTKNFVWIDDLSRFIDRLIKLNKWKYDVVNLACSKSNSIREIVSEIKRLTNSKSEIIVNNGIRKPFCIEAQKAREMGYESLNPLEIIKKYCESILS